MKCVVCGKEAEYIHDGSSICEDCLRKKKEEIEIYREQLAEFDKKFGRIIWGGILGGLFSATIGVLTMGSTGILLIFPGLAVGAIVGAILNRVRS